MFGGHEIDLAETVDGRDMQNRKKAKKAYISDSFG